jgi:hypothetical protein
MAGQFPQSADQLTSEVRLASTHTGPWPRISVWHGSSDRTVDASNATVIVEQWRGLHTVVGDPSVTGEGKYVRRAWQNGDGSDVIEEYIIAGMGHGVPLHCSGEKGCGAVGPYMLDVGIFSSAEICRFWGLAESRGSAENVARTEAPARTAVPITPATALAVLERLEPEPQLTRQKPHAGHVSNVQRVIEDALRTAGLMK